MTPADKARAWREELGYTRAALAEKIGYAPETIYWMELGKTPPGRSGRKTAGPVKPWVWLRYQRACEGLQREIDGRVFKW